MLKRLFAALLIFSLLLLLPYWWPLLKESVKTISSEVTGVAQTIEPNTQNRSQPHAFKPAPQKYQRKYVFEVCYSDQDGNSFCVDGTDPEYVYVHGRMSNTLWAKFEAFFKNLFSRASVSMNMRS